MEYKNVIKALEIIARVQRNTAAVTLKIGSSNNDNMVIHKEVVILNSNQAVLDILIENGFNFEMSTELGGLVLTDLNVKVQK
jgi:hypothetical protein